MKVSENTLNILTTLCFKGIGKAWIVKNAIWEKNVKETCALVAAKTKELDVSEKYNQYRKKVQSIVDSYVGIADGIIGVGDADFPECRGEVKDSDRPVMLAYKGDIQLLKKPNKNIAVIGVLNPLGDIEGRERRIVRGLVENNYTIVSGLALGCDSISHTEALRAKGKTVAILPSTLKNIQPQANRGLAVEIIEYGGLLVTEYLTEPFSRQKLINRYIERDRLQAYFSDCVVLAASYAPNPYGNDCGSRHALAAAKNASIKRAIMYNEASDRENPQFDLNRVVIQEDGAKALIVNGGQIDDFIREIGIVMIPTQGCLNL